MLLTNIRAADYVKNNSSKNPSANNHDHSLSCVFALSVLPESISVATCGIDTPPRPYTMAVPCQRFATEQSCPKVVILHAILILERHVRGRRRVVLSESRRPPFISSIVGGKEKKRRRFKAKLYQVNVSKIIAEVTMESVRTFLSRKLSFQISSPSHVRPIT